ncbi:MAG: hypothetical protein IRZ28_10365 [Steroidobacteraceae bacterium]|nr:hypothetical protein [Steroidobacteraceae bacterium]
MSASPCMSGICGVGSASVHRCGRAASIVVRGLMSLALILATSAYAQTGASDAAAASSEQAPAEVEQPRTFGYVIGDVLVQRVRLEANGRAVEPLELPSTGRVNAWFERRAVRADKRDDGSRWLTVEYQLINAPPELRAVRLPAWQLKTKTPGITLSVNEWLIQAGPITVPPTPGADTAAVLLGSSAPGAGSLQPEAAAIGTGLRPDHTPALIAESPIVRMITISGCALLLTIAAWVGWVLRRNYKAAISQPFASAWREIKTLDNDAPAAWQALHRAFDRTAGRVVQLDTLAELFRRAPHLASQREAIEQFFSQSSERFFGSGAQSRSISLHALCEALRRLERRYER